MGVRLYGCMELWNLQSGVADIMRYRVEIANVDTLSRFSGALSKKVFPSVSLYVIMGAWSVGNSEYECFGNQGISLYLCLL